jgi:CRP-like cAMP-binding protein
MVGTLAPAAPAETGRHELAERLAALLPDLRRDTIDRLTATARLRSVDVGDVIYAQGEIVPLTLILEGYGVARRTTADGQELLSGVAPAGVMFGYSAIGGQTSSVELIAITPAAVAQWPGADIRALVAADTGFALTAIDAMAASLHQTVERIEGFLHQDARRRVMRILARHRDLFFGETRVLNRAHLPGLVGTSPEMTRRVLRQLEQEGTVRRVGRAGLELLRPERLTE